MSNCLAYLLAKWCKFHVLYLCRRNDIMATKSFTDTYKIKRSDVSQFRNIMSDTRKLKIRKVKGHQDIRDKEEFRKMFGFSK